MFEEHPRSCWCFWLTAASLYNAANECFWEHEWSCHGSCSGWNQHDYFSNTINLHNNNDIAVSVMLYRGPLLPVNARLQAATHSCCWEPCQIS